MKIPFSPLPFALLCTATAVLSIGLQAQTESPQSDPAAPARAAEAPPAEVDTSVIDAWLLQPETAPAPSHPDLEAYLGKLRQRQEDLAKTIEFLVSKKRLREEAGGKANTGAAVPADLVIEKWDAIAAQKQNGALPVEEYAKASAAFAAKIRTVNQAQQEASLSLSKLLLRKNDEPEPVRHHVKPAAAAPATPAPASTPAPEHRPKTGGLFGFGRSGGPTPAPKPGAGKPAN